jgi:NAD-dependent SIR2 family protein deacetylase
MDIDADDLATVVGRLREASRVVWLTGAGISVASGISPYRKTHWGGTAASGSRRIRR